MIKHELEIIGFMVEGENIVVANPCTIPIGMLEDAIKSHKKFKDKKNVTKVGYIAIPIPKKFTPLKNAITKTKKGWGRSYGYS